MVEDVGEIELSRCDEANIPVNCFIQEPEDDEPKWRWSADNFMPRKEHCSISQYEVLADTKEELIALVRKYVVPLYEAALTNLRERGDNYYWEIPSTPPIAGRGSENVSS